jgi:diguanylate cyclase (GGDEF)-like protein
MVRMRQLVPFAHRGRSLSLHTRFGLLSAALLAMLGVVLGIWSAGRIRSTNVDEAVRLISFTKVTTVYTLTHLDQAKLPHSALDQSELGELIVDATLRSKRIAGLIIWRDGVRRQVLFSSGHLDETTSIHPPKDLARSFAGRTSPQLISSPDKTADPGVARLIAEQGPVLEVLSPMPATVNMPALVVQAFVPWRPVERNIVAQTWAMAWAMLGGLAVFWIAIYRLVARASRRLDEQIEHNRQLADHDPLTGLPNREMLRRRVDKAIAAAKVNDRVVGILLLDLDRFKEINDTLGHHHGDLLLRAIGPRLAKVLRDHDCIARLGGDEFVVLLPDLPNEAYAEALARRLRSQLSTPFLLEGVRLDVEASLGIAVYPKHGADFPALLQHADVAMYVAKKGSLGVAVYNPLLDEHSPTRLSLVGDLRTALSHPEQFELHYQPKANMATGKISGLEALVRWRHPERGLLPPDDFIPIAERTGMIQALTDIVLEKAMAQQKVWKQVGILLPVAINLSTRCLLDVHLPDDIGRRLTRHGLTGSDLELEITESAIMADPQRAEEVLTRLAGIGVGLAIDDFGTGYSSMAHLKRLPVHEIKIDKSFVLDLEHNVSDAAIVRSVVDLGRNLGLTVVAEGVENERSWDVLNELGCTTAQGFFLARPLTAERVAPWLASRRLSAAAIPLARLEQARRAEVR